MPALVAARYNPDLKAKYRSLIASGKPSKVALVTLMRKLIVMAIRAMPVEPFGQNIGIAYDNIPPQHLAVDIDHSPALKRQGDFVPCTRVAKSITRYPKSGGSDDPIKVSAGPDRCLMPIIKKSESYVIAGNFIAGGLVHSFCGSPSCALVPENISSPPYSALAPPVRSL